MDFNFSDDELFGYNEINNDEIIENLEKIYEYLNLDMKEDDNLLTDIEKVDEKLDQVLQKIKENKTT